MKKLYAFFAFFVLCALCALTFFPISEQAQKRDTDSRINISQTNTFAKLSRGDRKVVSMNATYSADYFFDLFY
jgi:hypothetical protein